MMKFHSKSPGRFWIIPAVIWLLLGCGLLQEGVEEVATLSVPTPVVTQAAAGTLPATLDPAITVDPTTLAPTATLPGTPTAEITPTVETTLDATAVIAPQVTIVSGEPSLNRDLLFIAGRSLRLRSATTGGVTDLLEAEGTTGVTAFSVTADGERLVAARLINAETRTFELIRVDIHSGQTWKLADAPQLLHFAVSPDGRYALYVAGGRPFPAGEQVAALEEDNPSVRPQAGTVYLADMESQQSRPVGQCVDMPQGADWSPEFLIPCQGAGWTRDSQNMVWADVAGIWLQHLNASQPTLYFPNSADLTNPPDAHYRPMGFAKNGRHLLVRRVVFEGLSYQVLDLVTREIIDLPDSSFGVGTGYVNVDWMQDDRLLKLRRRDNSGQEAPALELWRIHDDNTARLEETTPLTSLPPHQNIRFVQHFENGRFGFVLEANDPAQSGLYIMTSSTEQPERTNGLPYNQVSAVWQPDGSGAIIEQRDSVGNFLYTPVDNPVYYDLRSSFGPNAHAFFWRPS